MKINTEKKMLFLEKNRFVKFTNYFINLRACDT